MALVRATAMFKVYSAKNTADQKLKLRPNEYYYENPDGETCVKYTCQICEQIAKGTATFYKNEDEKFAPFQLTKGMEQCPCCGMNIEWDYRKFY